MRLGRAREIRADWRSAWPSRLLAIAVVTWMGVALSIGVILPRMDSTYALYSGQSVPKTGTYQALSGDTAFNVTPVPAPLGTYQAGGAVNSAVVLTIFNKTGSYTRKTNIPDLHVDLILDSAATLNVTVNCSKGNGALNPTPCDGGNNYSLNYGQTTRITISGTAGPTAGALTGYFRITALNGFLILDVPISGTVTAPPGGAMVGALLPRPSANPSSPETSPGDPVIILPVEVVPVVSEPLPVVSDPLPVISDPLPVISDPLPVISDPLPVVSDPLPVTSDPLPVTSDPLPVTADPLPVAPEPLPDILVPLPSVPAEQPPVVTPDIPDPVPVPQDPPATAPAPVMPPDNPRVPRSAPPNRNGRPVTPHPEILPPTSNPVRSEAP